MVQQASWILETTRTKTVVASIWTIRHLSFRSNYRKAQLLHRNIWYSIRISTMWLFKSVSHILSKCPKTMLLQQYSILGPAFPLKVGVCHALLLIRGSDKWLGVEVKMIKDLKASGYTGKVRILWSNSIVLSQMTGKWSKLVKGIERGTYYAPIGAHCGTNWRLDPMFSVWLLIIPGSKKLQAKIHWGGGTSATEVSCVLQCEIVTPSIAWWRSCNYDQSLTGSILQYKVILSISWASGGYSLIRWF